MFFTTLVICLAALHLKPYLSQIFHRTNLGSCETKIARIIKFLRRYFYRVKYSKALANFACMSCAENKLLGKQSKTKINRKRLRKQRVDRFWSEKPKPPQKRTRRQEKWPEKAGADPVTVRISSWNGCGVLHCRVTCGSDHCAGNHVQSHLRQKGGTSKHI